MSRWFGDIFQSGFVVHDWREAAMHWSSVLGVGPFFLLDHIEFEWCEYRGQPVELDLSVALGYSGAYQVELIQQHNDVESIYTEFKRHHGTGLQHVGVMVEDIDAALARHGLESRIVQQGMTAAGARFAYLDTVLHNGSMLELIQANDEVREAFADMQAAAASWDGTEPIRA